jgi:hypothetical protein
LNRLRRTGGCYRGPLAVGAGKQVGAGKRVDREAWARDVLVKATDSTGELLALLDEIDERGDGDPLFRENAADDLWQRVMQLHRDLWEARWEILLVPGQVAEAAAERETSAKGGPS